MSSSEPFTDTESVRSGFDPTVIDSDAASEFPLTVSVTVGSVFNSGDGVEVAADVGVGVATAVNENTSRPAVMRLVSTTVRANALFLPSERDMNHDMSELNKSSLIACHNSRW